MTDSKPEAQKNKEDTDGKQPKKKTLPDMVVFSLAATILMLNIHVSLNYGSLGFLFSCLALITAITYAADLNDNKNLGPAERSRLRFKVALFIPVNFAIPVAAINFIN